MSWFTDKLRDELGLSLVEFFIATQIFVFAGPGAAALYLGTTAVTHAFLPDLPTFENKGTLLNTRATTAPSEYVYGTIRKGGVISFMDSSGTDNKYLHMVISLAGNPVDTISSIYINDKIVNIDASNNVTDERWTSEDGTPAIRIKRYNGSQTSADADLVAETSADSSFVGRDIAYIYVRLKYDPDVFAGGIPIFTAVVKGKKVYDPRTGQTVWSDNAALCIRDYLVSDIGLNDSGVDDDFFSTAANNCDSLVSIASGGTQARYKINGVINAASGIGASLQDMISAANATLYLSGGTWKLKVGVFEPSVKSFTLDDLRGEITLPTRRKKSDNFNEIVGKFVSEDADWIETDYPAITSSIFVAEDNGVKNHVDLPLPFVTNFRQAQRVAKQTLYRSREQIVFMAEFGLSAIGIEVGDVIDLTIETYGWTNKTFEVVSWTLVQNEKGSLRVSVALTETSAAAFDWSAEEQDIISNNTTLPAFFESPNVGLAGSGSLRTVNEQVMGVLTIDVSTSSDQIDKVEVQYKPSAETKYISLGQGESTTREVLGISDGYYDFRARSINALGVRGSWNTVSDFYITIFGAPPQTVTDFTANVVGNTLHFTWNPVDDLDLSHYKIRYSNQTTGATYPNCIDLISKVSRPANSITAPAQTGTYFIKAVDKLGNVSENASSFTVLLRSVDLENLNVVASIQESPDFFGNLIDTVKIVDGSDTFITLDRSNTFDQELGLFDSKTGLFDGNPSQVIVKKSGSYEFSEITDLGSTFISRVSTNLDIRHLQYGNSFDSQDQLFDTKVGLFDGDPNQFEDTTAITQIATTTDDPYVNANWSNFYNFVVGDVLARGIKFRVLLKTQVTSAAPAIYGLSASIDMPDRLESKDDITYTGTTNVAFNSSFNAIPTIAISAVLNSGDYYVITNKSKSGFTISTFNSGNPSTSPTTIDFIAKGYGKQIT